MDDIERVAKTIYDTGCLPGSSSAVSWDGLKRRADRPGYVNAKAVYLNAMEAARAAIEVIRIPTDAMKYAGGTLCEDMLFGGAEPATGIIFEDIGHVFTRMIDAALSTNLKDTQ